MATNSELQPKRRRGPGRPFQPGQSGNPEGLPKEQREARARVKELLDTAFTRPDGTDALIDAIKLGVSIGDGSITRLACEYRWGKPTQPVEIEGQAGTMSLAQLLEQLPDAVAVLKGTK